MEKSIFTPEYAILRQELIGARTRAGLTQRELARRLRVPHSWVAKVESGDRRVDLVEVVWVFLACGEHPSALLAQLGSKLGALRANKPRKGGRAQ